MTPSGTSLTEVAQRAGVSIATASRVLNPPRDRHPVSEEARRRVLAAAAEVDYSLNALARGLKTQRSQTVGVIVHDVRDPYFNECARGINDAADAAGFLTVICNSDRDPDKELRYVQMLEEHRVAGVLFVGGGLEDRRYRAAMRQRVAAIRRYGGHAIALGPRADRLPAEVPDNRGGARRATEYLAELGHERIAFIAGPRGLRTSAERLAGHREGLEASGIDPANELVVPGDYSVAGGAAAMRGLLDAGERRFTAVFASNDAMAVGCMQELAQHGVRVPRDLSLVGFDDIATVRWLDPPLTTVAVPMAGIGVAGMRRLLRLLEGEPDRRPRTNVHPTSLVERASAAAVQERRASAETTE